MQRRALLAATLAAPALPAGLSAQETWPNRSVSVLLGYPVRQGDDMPAIAASALPVAFGDLKAGYTVVQRLGITTLRDPYSAKPFVEFYSRMRVGGDVTDFEAFVLMVVAAS